MSKGLNKCVITMSPQMENTSKVIEIIKIYSKPFTFIQSLNKYIKYYQGFENHNQIGLVMYCFTIYYELELSIEAVSLSFYLYLLSVIT